MARINDVGGMEGFGSVRPQADDPAFHADWEARCFALNQALVRRGTYSFDEFRNALEGLPPAEYLAASYYERWFVAMRALLVQKNVLRIDELPPW